jgi:hypothetical protein
MGKATLTTTPERKLRQTQQLSMAISVSLLLKALFYDEAILHHPRNVVLPIVDTSHRWIHLAVVEVVVGWDAYSIKMET